MTNGINLVQAPNSIRLTLWIISLSVLEKGHEYTREMVHVSPI